LSTLQERNVIALFHVHIRRLRAQIEKDTEKPEYVLTVRGAGYKFADIKQQNIPEITL